MPEAPPPDEEASVAALRARLHELTNARDALIQTRDAALAATRAKSMFLANMSHELRTPLSVILGYTEVLLRGDVAPAVANEHLETVRRCGEQLLALLDDVVDLSKIEAGRFDLERTTFSPRELVADVVRHHGAKAEEKVVAISIHAEPSFPATVLSDPFRVRQVVENLVSNALKFTSSGRIEVRLHHDTVRRRFEITVFDTGVGITAEQMETLFTPYHQAESSTRRMHVGTGLGLAISRHLARLLGGDLEATSSRKGTTFRASFDISGPASTTSLRAIRVASPSLTPAVHKAEPVHGRILVVDDTSELGALFALYLRGEGHTVALAENGQQAVKIAREARAKGMSFDLVIMDMQMPVMGGEEATALLRTEGFASPIVALTANALAGDHDRCLTMGCDDYLSKPVSREVLLQTANTHIARWRRLASLPMVSLLASDPTTTDLVEAFVRRLPDRVAAIRAAVGAGERARADTLLHQLKGAAGNFGFPSITEASRRIEEALASGEDAGSLFTALSELVSRARATS